MTRHSKQENKTKSNAPKKPALTHFLCIPLVNSVSKPQLEASIGKFKEDVCVPASTEMTKEEVPIEENRVSSSTIASSTTDTTDSGKKPHKEIDDTSTPAVSEPLIPEKAVRPIGSLHLTLGVMSLDEERLAQAQALLQSLNPDEMLHEAAPPKIQAENTLEKPAGSVPSEQPQSFKTAPLTISLESLEPMQSPRKTSILYISPQDPTNRLNHLCQALRTAFTDAGLLVPDTRPLKLHATIVNTIYVKGRKKKGKSKSNKKQETKQTDTKTKEIQADVNEGAKVGEMTHPLTQFSVAARPPLSTQPPLTANTPSSGHGPSATSSLYINATSILPRYATHVWASEVPISRIAICEMGVKKHVSADGKVEEAYKEVAIREM